MATPSSGLRRSYNCSALLPGGKFLLCGTDVGDMVVYGCVTAVEAIGRPDLAPPSTHLVVSESSRALYRKGEPFTVTLAVASHRKGLMVHGVR